MALIIPGRNQNQPSTNQVQSGFGTKAAVQGFATPPPADMVASGFITPSETVSTPLESTPVQSVGKSAFMQGPEAQQAIIANKEAQALRDQARKSNIFRFFLPTGESSRITFLTGAIHTQTNALDVPTAYEHNLKINGQWFNFYLCTQAAEDNCPMCAQEGGYAYLASYFFVIDHSQYMDKKGMSHVNELRLLVAKSGTRAQFEELAEHRGDNKGLVGATYKVTRGTAKDAAVGSNFMLESECTLAQLVDYMVQTGTPLEEAQKRVQPRDINQVIPYKTVAELSVLGIGSALVEGTPSLGSTLTEGLKELQLKQL